MQMIEYIARQAPSFSAASANAARVCAAWVCAAIISASLISTPVYANTTALLMVEQPDCPYCDRFNAEIGHMYGKTDEGKLAPLVRVPMNGAWPAQFQSIENAQFSPTFIVAHNGKEVGRINGYQGDEFFWFLLGEILDKVDQQE